jgi:hypothetical protein
MPLAVIVESSHREMDFAAMSIEEPTTADEFLKNKCLVYSVTFLINSDADCETFAGSKTSVDELTRLTDGVFASERGSIIILTLFKERMVPRP